MDPIVIDKTAQRKRRNDPAKKRSRARDLTPEGNADFLLGTMMQRITQALLDESTGISVKEIERRLEVDPGDADEMHKFRQALHLLHDKGQLARTATGFKRVQSPFMRSSTGRMKRS